MTNPDSHRPPTWRSVAGFGLFGLFHGSMFALSLWLLGSAWSHGITLASLCDLLLIPVVLLAGPFYLAGYIAYAVWRKDPGFQLQLVNPIQQPRYFELVTQAARELGMKPPRALAVHHGANGYALLWRHDSVPPTVGIGIPLFMGMGTQEMKAIIGHELGHLNSYGRRSPADRQLFEGYMVYRYMLVQAHPVARFLVPYLLYARLQLWVTWPFARFEEVHADDHGKIAGDYGNLALALGRIAQLNVLFRDYVARDIRPMLATGHVPENIYPGFRQYLAGLTLADYRDALERYEAFDRTRYHSGKLEKFPVFEEEEPLPAAGIMPESVFDPHPLLADRLDELRELQRRHPYRTMTDLPDQVYSPDPYLEAQLTGRLLEELYLEHRLERPTSSPLTPLSVAYGQVQERLASRARMLIGDQDVSVTEGIRRLLDPARHARVTRQAAKFKPLEACWSHDAAQRTILRALVVAELGTWLVRERGCRWKKEDGVSVCVTSPAGDVDLGLLADRLLARPESLEALLRSPAGGREAAACLSS